jgi:autophagy-related protein 9
MWEKINNSSLLFSKTFIENKSSISIYSNRVFFHRIYFYYIHKGYFKILINSIVNLLVTNFLVLFLLFLFNCVDYNGLFTLDTKTSLGDYVFMNDLLNVNPFFTTILILFLILDFIKIISVIDDAYIFSNIRKFYINNLKIRDSELEYLEWNEVLDIYKESVNNEVNPYYINAIITTKDNYFTALLDNKIIRPIHLNSLFEWNLIYCVIYSFIDQSEKISDKIFKTPREIEKSMQSRLKTISILSLIFMPLIMVIITFYNLFNYGEQFYNKPDLFISQSFTRLASLNLRNYNELTHKFDDRMVELNKITKKYSDTFKNKFLEAFLRLIIFIFSSFFVTLIILTLINDNILTNLNVIGGKNVLWFLGVVGSIIAIFRSIVNNKSKENPIDIMEEISNLIIIDQNFIDNANMRVIRNTYLKSYNLKITDIVYDIIWTLFMPIQLWSISYDTKYIVSFIHKISVNNKKIGIICSYADFENLHENIFSGMNENTEGPYFGSLLDKDGQENILKKCNFSLEKFKETYPNSLDNIFNENQSAQINVV